MLKLQQCKTFSVNSGDLLALNTSLVGLDWFSSMVCCL